MYIKAIMPVCRHLIDKARLLFVDSLSLQACYRRVMASDVKCTAEDYVVDMRSDVLTKPTPRMLQAMTQASLDDDVFREDRTTFGKWKRKQIGTTQQQLVVHSNQAYQGNICPLTSRFSVSMMNIVPYRSKIE